MLALVVIAAFVLVALNASTAAGTPSQVVVVAAKDLQARVPITADALGTASIPVPGTYPKVYFAQVRDLLGMVPLISIPAGKAITSNEVARPSQALGSQSEYLPIPSGYVAFTVPTSELQGVADNIQPDDYISVIATVSLAGKVADKTIFTNLHVIRVGTPGTAQGATNASSLTVVVTQCQAEVLNWFMTYASLKYTLESYRDYQPSNQAPDPACPNISAAKGVTLPAIESAYPSLFS